MSIYLRLFLLAFFLAVQPLFFCVKLKQKFAIMCPLCIMVNVFVILLSGLFLDDLLIGFWMVILIALMGVVCTIYQNKYNLKAMIQGYCDSSFQAFCIGVVIIFIITGRWVMATGQDWDGFMHWGKFIKQMMVHNRLYTDSDIFIPVHKAYAPALSLFQYMCCIFTGGYSEKVSLAANNIIILSSLLPLCLIIPKNTFLRATGVITTIYLGLSSTSLFYNIDANDNFHMMDWQLFNYIDSLYIDTHLGVLFSLYIIIALLQTEETKKLSSCLIVGIFIVLTKTTGLFFLLVGIGCIIITRLMQHGTYRNPINKFYIKKGKLSIQFFVKSLLLILPTFIWLLWNIYSNSIGNDINLVIQDTKIISKLLDIAFLNGTTAQHKIWLEGWNLWLTVPVTAGILKLFPISFIIVFILPPLMLYHRDKKEKKYIVSAIIVAIGYFAYASICLMEYTMNGIADRQYPSFTRYMTSYTTAMFILIIFFCLKLCETYNFEKKKQEMVVGFHKLQQLMVSGIMIIIIVLFIPPSLYPRLYSGQISEERRQWATEWKNRAADISHNLKGREELRFYIIFDTNDVWSYHTSSYELISPEINNFNPPFSTRQYDESPSEWCKELVDGGYTHIFIASLSAEFISKYQNFFDCPSHEVVSNGLYEIINLTERDVKFKKIDY